MTTFNERDGKSSSISYIFYIQAKVLIKFGESNPFIIKYYLQIWRLLTALFLY